MTVCGNLEALEDLFGLATVGYGLEGQLLAAAVCAGSGSDGAFIRRTPKRHGTEGRYDGALPVGSIEQVLCPSPDEVACQTILVKLGVAKTEVITFDVRRPKDDFAQLTGAVSVPAAAPLLLRDAVTLLHGQFKLSSGRRASRYWETLPAAHYFRVARNLVVAEDSSMNIVGVGHGGAYLAAVTAISTKRRPFIVDPSVDARKVLHRHCLLLDDFVTTGASFTRGLGGLSGTAQAASHCVALYGSAYAEASLPWVKILHVLS